MILFVIFSALAAMILYLFIAPMYFEIDTEAGLMRVRFHNWAKATLRAENGTIHLQLKIAWWGKDLDILEMIGRQRPAKNNVNKHTKSSTTFKIKRLPQRMLQVMKSFTVQTFYITFDTGSMAFNGILYPWVMFVRWYIHKDIHINFVQENCIKLTLRNSIASMVWAFIK